MNEEVYRELARRLDAIPNGFPATQSGIELRLLAKMYTPEEAALAALMRLSREPAAEIAARAGLTEEAAYETLKAMARRGLIRAGRGKGGLSFGLMPFVVGVYEAQLSRLDEEMASLFEQYYREVRGGFVGGQVSSVHRVIPVEEAISIEVEIFPYERASELIEQAKSWAVRDCICRVQQRLIGKGCDHGVENCLVFAPVENAFKNSAENRAISKEDALRLLAETEAAGLVHTTGNYRDDHSYICNCCTCCCGILRSVAEFGFLTGVAHSDFVAVVDEAVCAGCGDCLQRCQFGALSLPEDVCQVERARCVGCGLCAPMCPTGALQLERRPAGETPPVPDDIEGWMKQRAAERGLVLEEIW